MPWSMALRTRCVSGSRMASMIVLSSSVSWPSSSMRACLPQATARSRTTRGKLAPDVADRLHARLHDVDLQLGGQQVQPLHRAQEGGVLLGGAELHDLVPRQHQLADQGHELVEQADVHADGAVGDGRGARLRRLRGEGRGWRGRDARRSSALAAAGAAARRRARARAGDSGRAGGRRRRGGRSPHGVGGRDR